MFIKYLGHACFLLTTQDKKKIVIDPYHPGPRFNYAAVDETADIVTKSHEHGDHNAVESVKGNPEVLSKPGAYNIKGIDIKGIAAFHDTNSGSQRGGDVIFCFKAEGLTVCHLGDLGHTLTKQQLSAIGPVDVLLMPVGGFFTMDAQATAAVAEEINPRVLIPMHYKTAKSEGLPIAGVEDFLKGKSNIRRLNSSELEVKASTLPEKTEIVVMLPAN